MANDSYSALSDPTRRRILSALRNGSRPVGELVEELEVSQPTVSKHLKVLRDTGLVATRAEGQKRFYSVESQPLRDVSAWIEELLTAAVESATTAEVEAEDAPGRADAVKTAESSTTEAAEAAETPPVEEASEVVEVDRDIAEDAPEITENDEPVTAPLHAEEPRNLPWFTSAQAVEEHEQDRVEAEVTEISEPMESEPGIAEPPAFDVISDEESEIGHENLQELLDDSEVSNISTLPDAVALDTEVEVTGTSVGANTDVTSAESSADSDEFADPNSTKPEFGIPPARSGGAHRRQSGLLSTLTGFRRRGRSSRR
ncbi:metalloregulator ArsR/SmtB family transcription factor [Kocuria carniphila]|uniref:ArsR/SmtB family transcription factor n=1 Tax=Kocuria carniphila TaxID=262208 RepID=UPI0028EF5B45|nr:metalloregulator ArsR/SmtB family transcription factor [Kocuria carniphila]